MSRILSFCARIHPDPDDDDDPSRVDDVINLQDPQWGQLVWAGKANTRKRRRVNERERQRRIDRPLVWCRKEGEEEGENSFSSLTVNPFLNLKGRERGRVSRQTVRRGRKT